MKNQDLIVEWSPNEREAWQICLYWLEFVKKVFPGYRYTSLPKKGDPRKGILFRHAWKMLRDTKAYGLKPTDRSLYVKAQLEMIKNTNGRVDSLILTGEKSWIRWKMWKRKYDKINKVKVHTYEDRKMSLASVVNELKATRDFFLVELGKLPNYKDLVNLIKSFQLREWTNQKLVSPYYFFLSPLIGKILTEKEIKFYLSGIDLEVYKKDIDSEVVTQFKLLFQGEE